MVHPRAAGAAAMEGHSDRGEDALGHSRRALASKAGVAATGAGGAVDLDLWRRGGSDTLISEDQLWEDSKVDTIFNSTRCITVPDGIEGGSLDLPFERMEHLYKWAFIPTNRHASLQGVTTTDTRALKATIHRPHSTSFFNALPPDEALELLHRRLHIG